VEAVPPQPEPTGRWGQVISALRLDNDEKKQVVLNLNKPQIDD
jgi:cell wall assembly regulator SMI1